MTRDASSRAVPGAMETWRHLRTAIEAEGSPAIREAWQRWEQALAAPGGGEAGAAPDSLATLRAQLVIGRAREILRADAAYGDVMGRATIYIALQQAIEEMEYDPATLDHALIQAEIRASA